MNGLKMEDTAEIALRTLCCTCLSSDRKLSKLCRINDGVNILYFLLSSDLEAYREGFYKEAASLLICWECAALMRRITRFRRQACLAQRQMAGIEEGRNDTNPLTTCLSFLVRCLKTTYDFSFDSDIQETDNFIDCGPELNTEADDLDDIPLSELHDNCMSDNDRQIEENVKVRKKRKLKPDNECEIKDDETNGNAKVKMKKKLKSDECQIKEKDKVKTRRKSKSDNVCQIKENDKVKTKRKGKVKESQTEETVKIESTVKKRKKLKDIEIGDKYKDYFVTTELSEKEMVECREKMKKTDDFVDAAHKCESCVEVFKNQNSLERHKQENHVAKTEHAQCLICLSFVKSESLSAHKSEHHTARSCLLCDQVWYSETQMVKHLGTHNRVKRKKSVPSEGTGGRRARPEQPTADGYPCRECNKYFKNLNQRWKHVQRHHRLGHECATCGKRFAFKNVLIRHLQVHESPLPRAPCPHCRKLVRVDLLKTHARIHSPREQHACVECGKKFVGRASYEQHLKYTQAHATKDLLRYKCELCPKGYRSPRELRDHVNYYHIGQTLHKCPICGKALATSRCILRHVRRAHHGIRERPRDKICQQCGKAFRDNKGLHEHEFIHTGERPLSCELCGSTFRQSASLYTHKKRVHKIFVPKKTVEVVGTTDGTLNVVEKTIIK